MIKILHIIRCLLDNKYRRFDACMNQAEYHIDEALRLIDLSLDNIDDPELTEYYKQASLQHKIKAEDFKRHADCYM